MVGRVRSLFKVSDEKKIFSSLDVLLTSLSHIYYNSWWALWYQQNTNWFMMDLLYYNVIYLQSQLQIWMFLMNQFAIYHVSDPPVFTIKVFHGSLLQSCQIIDLLLSVVFK